MILREIRAHALIVFPLNLAAQTVIQSYKGLIRIVLIFAKNGGGGCLAERCNSVLSTVNFYTVIRLQTTLIELVSPLP
jgi:predicted transcriptional regulator